MIRLGAPGLGRDGRGSRGGARGGGAGRGIPGLQRPLGAAVGAIQEARLAILRAEMDTLRQEIAANNTNK